MMGIEDLADNARAARAAITAEFANRYLELEEKAQTLQFEREEFYRDIANLKEQFTPESLAAVIGVTRDAVYQWRKRGMSLNRVRECRDNIG